jgi:hypothetical protein
MGARKGVAPPPGTEFGWINKDLDDLDCVWNASGKRI